MTFKRCQLCDFESDDICEFRMWRECDTENRPIDSYLVTCKQEKCFKIIEDDDLLYIEVPWSRGGPGKFMLVCGDCSFREGFNCIHPDLTSNGGDGLEVFFTPTSITGTRVCFNGKSFVFKPPVTTCIGNPKN